MLLPDTLNTIHARFKVRFADFDREITTLENETLLQSARREGIRIVGACGGRGVCKSCEVRAISGRLDSSSSNSANTFSTSENREWVCACQVRAYSDCVVEVAPRSLAPVARTDVAGLEDGVAFECKHAVKTYEIELAPSGPADRGADLDRLMTALGKGTAEHADISAVRSLPTMLRENNWRVRAIVRDDELIGCCPVGERVLGLAVDLGTTNIAGFLVDLETGECLGSLGIENPQAMYGADLISRINHAIRTSGGGYELQCAARDAVESLARELCAAVSAHPDNIIDVTLCGNTVMHHLLLGLPLSQLGRAPFTAAMCSAMDVRARDLNLRVMAGAYLHVLPNIGAYIGGDHVATLMATETRWANTTSIVMDIGTNTEISLIHAGRITSASCPSGPALEGGHISAGMRAAEGAIEQVHITGGEVRIRVIGDVSPVGLCGSGVIDTVATLHQAGILDKRGHMLTTHPAVRERDGQREFVIAPGVTVTQDDVHAVQLAKASIRAGIDLLLHEAGIGEQKIERILIAGAFGNYIDITSAISIGLLPLLTLDRFEQVGNAAGVGVRMALVSATARIHARDLASRCNHIELSSAPDFQKVFINRISLNQH